MRIKREVVLNYLYPRQDERGGYTGQDIVTLARRTGVSRKGLKLKIDEWSVTDPRFSELKYLGKRSVSITLDDVFLIVQLLNENPLIVKQDILDEINRLHSIKGL